jgi:hypothetical protein
MKKADRAKKGMLSPRVSTNQGTLVASPRPWNNPTREKKGEAKATKSSKAMPSKTLSTTIVPKAALLLTPERWDNR